MGEGSRHAGGQYFTLRLIENLTLPFNSEFKTAIRNAVTFILKNNNPVQEVEPVTF